MIFLFLGILVIVLGMSYRVYQIYFKIKNTQAKAIYEEIKKRVDEGDKREAYLDLVEDEIYETNYCKLIKRSRLTKEDIAELKEAVQKNKVEKKSGVRGISRLSIRIGRIVAVVGFIVVFAICMRFNQTALNCFVYAIISGQLVFLIVIMVIESIREGIKRKAEKI